MSTAADQTSAAPTGSAGEQGERGAQGGRWRGWDSWRGWRGLVLPVAAVLAWWALSRAGLVNSALLVSPAKVLDTGVAQILGGKFWRALAASLAREFAGFLIGTAAGLVLGALLGLSRGFNRLVGPSFNTFKQISLFAWIPLISVWFGLGDTAKVVFLSLAALVPVVVNTCDGIRGTPEALLEVARVYGYSRTQAFFHVVLPAATPAIFTGVYLALIYSWLATIGAEYLLVAGVGIGNLLIEGSEHFQMDLVIFGMIVVGVVGWLMNAITRKLEHRLARLRGAAQ
ncbi:ABC transporter permease [Achromobacter aloeverae]|uniref:Taurine ABC transporter permease n=1 Tax=Achromobacter aloeverae TaxID=1750518 RepID=A0A4Q1HF96_9BURK|nr:ABC transporter permease [Achromobacter aloeverae]RXN85272.1 taurine ABC transporter permease [Achromobacter aloeverae]